MATGLTKKQKEVLTDKITGLIKNSPALRMTLDSSVNEMNINQISGELNRIHYRAIGKEFPVEINIPVKQLGSGDPSPDNIRPFVGYEIDGIGTVYGGDLNIETGALTVTYQLAAISALRWTFSTSAAFRCFTTSLATDKKPGLANVLCDRYTTRNVYNTENDLSISGNLNNVTIYIRDNSCQGDVNNFLTAAGEGLIVYELATPETYTLTPQQMLQLLDQL